MTDLPAKRSLRTIMLDLSLSNEEDPAFNKLTAEQRAKVDATCWYIDKLESQIEKLQTDWINVLLERKAKLQAAREKRLLYVKQCMELYGISLLKGDVRKIALAISPPALTFTEQADDVAYFKYPMFVEVIPPQYRWDKIAIKKRLDEGQEIPFVQRTQGSHLIYKPRKKKK